MFYFEPCEENILNFHTCINYDPDIHEIILELNHLAYKT